MMPRIGTPNNVPTMRTAPSGARAPPMPRGDGSSPAATDRHDHAAQRGAESPE